MLVKKSNIEYFVKIRPVGSELFHNHRKTGMRKIGVNIRKFANGTTIGRDPIADLVKAYQIFHTNERVRTDILK